MSRREQVQAALRSRGLSITAALPRGTVPELAREIGCSIHSVRNTVRYHREVAALVAGQVDRPVLPEARTEAEACSAWGCYCRAVHFGPWAQYCQEHAPEGMR